MLLLGFAFLHLGIIREEHMLQEVPEAFAVLTITWVGVRL